MSEFVTAVPVEIVVAVLEGGFACAAAILGSNVIKTVVTKRSSYTQSHGKEETK